MKKIYITLLLVTLLVSTACQKEIKFENSKTQSLITINGILEADSTISVHVSRSRFFLDNDIADLALRNANVTLIAEGQTLQLTHQGDGLYTSDYIPRAGKPVEMKVSAPDLASVSASTTLPERPNLGKIVVEKTTSEAPLNAEKDNQPVKIGSRIFTNLKIKIPVIDKKDEQNFYRLIVVRKQSYRGQTYEKLLTELLDPVFKTESPEIALGPSEPSSNRYKIFSDVRFNGSTYEIEIDEQFESDRKVLPEYKDRFYFYEQNRPYEEHIVYQIQLQQLSPGYFMYLRTRNAYTGMGSDAIPFIEPIQIYSNVTDGTGILGSCTVAEQNVAVDVMRID